MWQWSGGFASYVAWATGEPVPVMGPGASDAMWQSHQKFAIRFYESAPAKALWFGFVRTLLLRRNTINGMPYNSDPTIMAWQVRALVHT